MSRLILLLSSIWKTEANNCHVISVLSYLVAKKDLNPSSLALRQGLCLHWLLVLPIGLCCYCCLWQFYATSPACPSCAPWLETFLCSWHSTWLCVFPQCLSLGSPVISLIGHRPIALEKQFRKATYSLKIPTLTLITTPLLRKV